MNIQAYIKNDHTITLKQLLELAPNSEAMCELSGLIAERDNYQQALFEIENTPRRTAVVDKTNSNTQRGDGRALAALQEAMRLVQVYDCADSEAHKLAAYVVNQAVGEEPLAVNNLTVTLATLCLTQSVDMHIAGLTPTKIQTA